MMWNPKNWVLAALAVLVVVSSGMYLWQRVTLKNQEIVITKQKNEISIAAAKNIELQAQIGDYKKNIEAAKKTQREQQNIQTTTSIIFEEIERIKTVVTLEETDEKIISDATYFFYSGGMRRQSGDDPADSKTGGEVLPQTSSPSVDRPHWTIKQIISNYLEVIDYALKLERTVECYEQN